MSLAFYMDENVHAAITHGLRLREVDVLTVQEDSRAGLSDPLVLDRATELGRVVFTQDRDFLVESNRRQSMNMGFVGVIYAHQLIVSIGDCIRDLEIIAKIGNPEDFTNRVQFLPL
ncbi:DUF5615 family PIN-like protein [Kovacikia minuta CCNUW1]|uniref:DUF5615 family PIN-like protein n=1 Tax=Kovacikia minuta TaxID=2931930 RepID=UPI001CCA8A42|nr:DUF5615 family PIN-like protein [Kovacikia minuta]UBF26327.1 DUF5615 family PIN-like protein [Kovacikia minuta CCNUW1]